MMMIDSIIILLLTAQKKLEVIVLSDEGREATDRRVKRTLQCMPNLLI
jgi:hypothetical protein